MMKSKGGSFFYTERSGFVTILVRGLTPVEMDYQAGAGQGGSCAVLREGWLGRSGEKGKGPAGKRRVGWGGRWCWFARERSRPEKTGHVGKEKKRRAGPLGWPIGHVGEKLKRRVAWPILRKHMKVAHGRFYI
jgi:hypothetical protein